MDDSPSVSPETWVERQQIIGEAILRWTKRPPPENNDSSRALKPERKTRRNIYYDGRFYNEPEVFDCLSHFFGVTSWPDIIRMSHEHIYGMVTERAQRGLDVAVRDHTNGSALPLFVMTTFVDIRSSV